MKIAVIGVKKIPTTRGNLEQYCQELYTSIAERGHTVDIFTQLKYRGNSCFSVHYYKKIRVINLVSLPGKYLGLLFNSALNTIWATFGNYDVIHIYGIKNAWFIWFAQLFAISKIVVTCQKLDSRSQQQPKILIWLLEQLEKTVVQNADKIIVDSKALETHFRQQYNLNPYRIPNAPRGYLSTKNHKFSYGKTLGLEPKKYILYLGKLEPQQEPDLIIKAFQQLDKTDWKLVLAGEIGNYPQYASELLHLAQHSNIIFSGETRDHNLAEVLRYAGLLVIPTSQENLKLPLAMLEAMGEGVPVLASDITIHREIIGQERGLLFSAKKLTSLTSQLEYALSQPQVLSAMTRKAQTYISIHHNWDRIIYKSLFLYLQPITTIPIQPPKYRTLDN